MAFHEYYGEIPASLLRAIKKYKVTPAEFYTFEAYGLSFDQMEKAIKDNSPNGIFNAFQWGNTMGGRW